MTLARSVADVLSDHVTLEIESIDRMYLNLYVPKLQYESGIVGFFRGHLGYTFASSALMDPITKDFVKAIERFCEDEGVDLIRFEKGQRKDDIAHEYLESFEGKEGVLFVGKAQEKTTTFRTEKRTNPYTGRPYPWIVRAVLHLLPRRRLRSLLHQVQLLLPLQRETLHQRERVGQVPGGQSRHRVRASRQRVLLLRGSGPTPAHL
jgi:hypothetical protein